MLLAGETLSISPGKSLGPLILKKTSAAEVVRMLGRPDAEEPDEELVGYSVYYYARRNGREGSWSCALTRPAFSTGSSFHPSAIVRARGLASIISRLTWMSLK